MNERDGKAEEKNAQKFVKKLEASYLAMESLGKAGSRVYPNRESFFDVRG